MAPFFIDSLCSEARKIGDPAATEQHMNALVV